MAQLEPASVDILGQLIHDAEAARTDNMDFGLRRLGFPLSDLRLTTESSTHDGGAVSLTNGDMTSQLGTMEHALGPTIARESFGFRDFSSQPRRNREDTHNSVNPPQPSRDSGHSELLSHGQTGNNLTTSGFNLGDLDCDEVVHNTSPHPQVEDGNTTSMEDLEGGIDAFNIGPGTDSQ